MKSECTLERKRFSVCKCVWDFMGFPSFYKLLGGTNCLFYAFQCISLTTIEKRSEIFGIFFLRILGFIQRKEKTIVVDTFESEKLSESMRKKATESSWHKTFFSSFLFRMLSESTTSVDESFILVFLFFCLSSS